MSPQSSRRTSASTAPRCPAAVEKKLQETEFPTLLELRRSIPAHLFTSNLATSLMYAAWDVLVVSVLMASMFYVRREYGAALPTAALWALNAAYWVVQGTMFWAIFVIAHDCGHGAFSRHLWVNDMVGNMLNGFLLVPYASWQSSHRSHHKNTCNIDKDEVFYPIRKKDGPPAPMLKQGYFGLGLSWFMYIAYGYGPRGYSFFNPLSTRITRAKLLLPISVATCAGMAYLVYLAAGVVGWQEVGVLYGVPLFVFASWLVVTTFLHHHDENVPWFADSEWDYVKGNLSSVDRHYGIFHAMTHHIGTHQVHHLFPVIPHYHLEDATKAFRAAYPHLARTSSESVASAFITWFRAFASQNYIADDAKFHVYHA